MHKEILTKEQVALLPLVRSFSKEFGLVGGTAVALHLGHRRSIDFDLFTFKAFDNRNIRRKLSAFRKSLRVIRDEEGQYTLFIRDVRFTFLHYPYHLPFSRSLKDVVRMPDLLTLAAMKAFALGRRAKWKDYIDLYFIMKHYRGIRKIAAKAKRLFGVEFNEKLFRVQLAYFKDVDDTEKVIYLEGREVSDATVRKGLIEFSLQ